MNDLEELRQLREVISSLQFGLLSTLNFVETLGEHMGAGQLHAEDIQATKQDVMNLGRQPSPSDSGEPTDPSNPDAPRD